MKWVTSKETTTVIVHTGKVYWREIFDLLGVPRSSELIDGQNMWQDGDDYVTIVYKQTKTD